MFEMIKQRGYLSEIQLKHLISTTRMTGGAEVTAQIVETDHGYRASLFLEGNHERGWVLECNRPYMRIGMVPQHPQCHEVVRGQWTLEWPAVKALLEVGYAMDTWYVTRCEQKS